MTYVFGTFPSGFCQFPDDSNSDIFHRFVDLSTAYAQIIIHRVNNLMYYGYTYQIENGGIFGFCHVINNAMINDHKGLFEYFTGKVVGMAQRGELIRITENGIEPAVSELNIDEKKAWLITQSIDEELCSSELFPKSPLPPTNYSLSIDSSITFSLDDDVVKRIRASHTYGYTIIVHSIDDNISLIYSFSSQLRDLNEKISVLKKENSILRTKQRNTFWVCFLSLVVVFLGMILWNTVLFPSEVTNKDMGEYNYYGEMRNGQPNGRGVAFFKDDDAYDRTYYVGRFSNGEIHDENGLVFYNDGSVYSGKIYKDYASEGKFISPADSFYYSGTFINKLGGFKNGIVYDIVKRTKYTDNSITEYTHEYKYSKTYSRPDINK